MIRLALLALWCAFAAGCAEEDPRRAFAAHALPAALPPSHGNALADDAAAGELGFRLFYDARLSANNEVRCASCHAPEEAFADGVPVSTAGLGRVTRNAPTVLNAARYRWLFWDGRADSLWSQAIGPILNPDEMGLSKSELKARIGALHGVRYQAVFGPLGDDEDAVAANVGKALEAAQRKMAAGRSRFDRFLEGGALEPAELRGLSALRRGGCLDCHAGPLFSDEQFHDVGTADGDLERARGLELLRESPFNAAGRFYDGAPPAELPDAPRPEDRGAYRTPSLRNLPRTAPYGHDGRWATLAEAVRGHGDPLPGSEVADVVALLGALAGDAPPPPWNDWPHY